MTIDFTVQGNATAALGAITTSAAMESFTRQNLFQAEPITIGHFMDKPPQWLPPRWLPHAVGLSDTDPYMERRRYFYLYSRYAGYLSHAANPRSWGQFVVTERLLKEKPLACFPDCPCRFIPHDYHQSFIIEATPTTETRYLPQIPYTGDMYGTKRRPCSHCGGSYAYVFHHHDKETTERTPPGFICDECRKKFDPVFRSMVGLPARSPQTP